MWWLPFQHWLAVHTGTVNEPGPYYGFWSGFGGIMERLVELAVIGFILLRRNNCEVHHCWRLGKHATAAGHHVCRLHHPESSLTSSDIAQADLDARTASTKLDEIHRHVSGQSGQFPPPAV